MKIVTMIVGLLLATVAQAQELKLKVATGSNKGTYAQMYREINSFCNETVVMQEVSTSGSIENLSLLLDNQASAAFVQTDVLFFKDKTDNIKGQVKTLLALHPEEVHFLALTDSKLTAGGFHGIGAKQVVFNNVGDLGYPVRDGKGAIVGAAGGSYITAQLFKLLSDVPYQIVQLNSGDEVLAALAKGYIDAAVFVGGQPLGNIKDLGPQYKLLPVPETITDKLKSVYRPARLKYPKMTANSIPTVATDALFVTGDYKSPSKVASLKAFHDCVLAHLVDFQEQEGYHAKWRSVDATNTGKWDSIYAFPTVKATAKATKKHK